MQTKSIISETSNKIDTEIASLKTLMESSKLETIRYLAGKSVCRSECLDLLVPTLRITMPGQR